MATATATAAPAPAPQLPGLSSSPTAEDRPAPLNQDQIEADDDTAEADSAFGSEMYSFLSLVPGGRASVGVFR